jgi:hypothetical protein
LLHLRKKTKKWRQGQGGSLSFATFIKKRLDDNEPPSSSSSSTIEEGKKERDDDELGRLTIICYIWEKKQTDEDEPLGSSSSSTPEKKKKKMTMSLLEEKTKRLVFSLHFSTTHFVCTKLSKRRGWARRLVVVSCNPRKTNIKVFFLGLQRTMTSIAFIVIFCRNLVRTVEDESECNTRNRLLYKGTKVKKNQRLKKGWCTLTCHICTNYVLEESFLQHHFNVFNNTTSTPLLQHCFNTAFATLSFAVALQHHFCSTVVCSIAFALEW